MRKFELPTLERLKSVAEKHHMHISDEDLNIHLDTARKTALEMYSTIDKYQDECLPVKYKFSVHPPLPEENHLNGWAWMTDVQGAKSGKLNGKTIAIKNCISMAGVPLTIGSTFMEGYVSQFNATIIERILDAGGIIKGASTTENMTFCGSSFTPASGYVLNPHDVTRSAGGSSSGSGALVASGAVDMALGSDAGGSIRMPASWCGIVGLKPTHGLVPNTGYSPLDPILDVVGPMTRTVKDSALLLEVIAGSDNGLDTVQPVAVPVKEYTKELTGDAKNIRVGLLKEGFEDCEPDVAELTKKFAYKLETVGGKVEEFSSKLHAEAGLVGFAIVTGGKYLSHNNGGIAPIHGEGFKDVTTHDFMFKAARTRADHLHPGVQNALLMNGYIMEEYGVHYYAKAVNILRSVKAGFKEQIFSKYDVIVMPSTKYKAPKLLPKYSTKDILDKYARNVTNTLPYNATGHPAVSVNVGFSEGLPVGLMIVGRHWEDDLVLKVAYAVEQLRESNV